MLLVDPFVRHWARIKPSREAVMGKISLLLTLAALKFCAMPDAGTVAALKALGWR